MTRDRLFLSQRVTKTVLANDKPELKFEKNFSRDVRFHEFSLHVTYFCDLATFQGSKETEAMASRLRRTSGSRTKCVYEIHGDDKWEAAPSWPLVVLSELCYENNCQACFGITAY